jgi:hypothetical protein
VHVQLTGQSESTPQLVARGWQYPGKELVVVHVDGGSVVATPASTLDGGVAFVAGAPTPVAPPAAAAPPVPIAGGAVPEPPEHTPVTVGEQTKSTPQSESTLHGNCHLKAQAEIVVWVHVVGEGVGADCASHGELAGHATTTAVPPLHDELVSPWHTIPGAQSTSTWQGAGWQVISTASTANGLAHVAPAGQVGTGVGAMADDWQVVPCGQSALDAQTCASATIGMNRTATTEPIPNNNLVSDMVSPFLLGTLSFLVLELSTAHATTLTHQSAQISTFPA